MQPLSVARAFVVFALVCSRFSKRKYAFNGRLLILLFLLGRQPELNIRSFDKCFIDQSLCLFRFGGIFKTFILLTEFDLRLCLFNLVLILS